MFSNLTVTGSIRDLSLRVKQPEPPVS